jgi:hypothetical protein
MLRALTALVVLCCALLHGARALHILVIPFPGHAVDSLPSLAPAASVAHELRARGHCVSFVAHPSARPLLGGDDLRLIALPHFDPRDRAADPSTAELDALGTVVRSGMAPLLRAHAAALNGAASAAAHSNQVECAPRINAALIDFDLMPLLAADLGAASVPFVVLASSPIDSTATAVHGILSDFDHESVASVAGERRESLSSYLASLSHRLAAPLRRLFRWVAEIGSPIPSLVRDRIVVFPSAPGLDSPRPLPPHVHLAGLVSLLSESARISALTVSATALEFASEASATGEALVIIAGLPVAALATASSPIVLSTALPATELVAAAIGQSCRVLWTMSAADFLGVRPLLEGRAWTVTPLADRVGSVAVGAEEWYRVDVVSAKTRVDTRRFGAVTLRVLPDAPARVYDSASIIAEVLKIVRSHSRVVAALVATRCDAVSVFEALALGAPVLCLSSMRAHAVVARRVVDAGVGVEWAYRNECQHQSNQSCAAAAARVLASAIDLHAVASNEPPLKNRLASVRVLLHLGGGSATVADRIEHVAAFGVDHIIPYDWARARLDESSGARHRLEALIFGADFSFVWILLALWASSLCRRCCCCCCAGSCFRPRQAHAHVQLAPASCNDFKKKN